ncbi:SHOCT domain-containing protein [Actinomadura barringtoniae]|uniref:SHOCT domain-containing protein n=1 Tax=Actinomadura barringtoniae TaxID=1427535 RepID=A0A939PIX3_9ACTN|nr:SHOCT domain-containing protein [Actinomadura barringtoniae]MBO2450659.1 SHOCT domain-containing protein [Actinomadura barringtoniae]
MIVRGRGRPLLRGALVGGTAYAMGRRAANSAQREAQQSADIAELQAQQAYAQPVQAPPPPAPAQAPAGGGTVADQLLQLGQMVQQGLLSQEEYAAAKAKLLA